MMMPTIGPALDQLESIVRDRLRYPDSTDSYVASLARKGRKKIAQKFGEEATETVIAAVAEDDDALVAEASDLIFHLTVLLNERGIGWDAIGDELNRRHGTSGIVEKSARKSV